MKVAIVLNELNRGGIGAYCRGIIEYFGAENNIDKILVICSVGNLEFLSPEHKKKVKILEHPIPNFLTSWPLKEVHLAYAFRNTLDKLRNYQIILNYSVLKGGFVERNKIICVFHSLHLQFFYSHSENYLLFKLFKLLHLLMSVFDTMRHKYSHLTVFASENALKDAVNKYKFEGKKCVYLPNYIDVESKNFKYTPKSFYKIVNIGRLDPFKGIELYSQFANYLRSVDKRFECYFVGDGWNYLKKYKNIHFLGTVNHSKIENIYKNSYLHVSTSYLENSSTTLLESIRYDLPIISSDTGEAGKILKKNYIFEVGSLEGLVKAFNEFKDTSRQKVNMDFSYSKKTLQRNYAKRIVLSKLFAIISNNSLN